MNAFDRKDNKMTLDLGKCLFCGQCAAECPEDAIEFTREHSMATRERSDLLLQGTGAYKRATELGSELLRIFGRSFVCGKSAPADAMHARPTQTCSALSRMTFEGSASNLLHPRVTRMVCWSRDP